MVALDGEAKRKDIEAELEGRVDGWLKEGDYVTNSHGVPRWQTMIRRARKSMVKEGFLSDENLLKWIITKKGERIVKKDKASK